MKISILGVFLFFIAGLAFAQTPVIALLSKTTPAEMVWERSLFTAFFLFGFIKFGFLIRLKLLSETSVRPNRIYEAYVGLWGAINTALFSSSCILTTPIRVYAMFYSFPFISLLFDLLRGKRTTLPQVCATVAGLLVMALFVYADWGSSPMGWGEVCALASAVVWIVFSNLAKKLETPMESLRAPLYGQIIVLIFMSVFCLINGVTFLNVNPQSLGWITLLGFTTAIALFCCTCAAKLIPVHIQGLFLQMDAPIGLFSAWLFLSKPVAPLSLVAGAMIFFVAFFAVWTQKSEN